MRLSRLVLLSLAVGVAAACENDKVTTPDVPAHSDIRWINAIADTGAVDIRFIDQVDLSPPANNLAFRAGTVYLPAESKARHIRVFPTSNKIDITSQVLLDTMLTIPQGKRLTFLLTGASRTAGALKFIQIEDETTAPSAGSIGIRTVNASTGAVSGYLVNAVGDALPGSATFANVGSFAASSYVNRATGSAALRFTDPGSSTVNASQAGPATPTQTAGTNPAAGVGSAGTLFSVYYFPKARAGSVVNPGAVWFVDRNPCDAGC
jgi:hypothetical protein